jgi:membrane-associated phospholipid phosphatase
MLSLGLRRAIRAVDLLTFCFLLFLLIITTLHIDQIPRAYLLISIYSILMISLSLLVYLKRRNNGPLFKVVNDIVFPVIVVFLIFDSLGGLIRYINPASYDQLLLRLDYLVFGFHPTVELERITTPLITEIMQFAYVSYYFLPLILGITLKMEGRDSEFDLSLFLIILCFFLSYIGYILVPAIGPRYTIQHLQSIELKGVFLRERIDSLLNAMEGVKYDAFPSGHSGIALLSLYLSYRFKRNLFYVMLPVVIALLFSTVYLRYHYVVDVIGGVLLFLITVFMGERIYNCWQRMG